MYGFCLTAIMLHGGILFGRRIYMATTYDLGSLGKYYAVKEMCFKI